MLCPQWRVGSSPTSGTVSKSSRISIAILIGAAGMLLAFWLGWWRAPAESILTMGRDATELGAIEDNMAVPLPGGGCVWLYREVFGIPVPEGTSSLDEPEWDLTSSDECVRSSGTGEVDLPTGLEEGAYRLCDPDSCVRFKVLGPPQIESESETTDSALVAFCEEADNLLASSDTFSAERFVTTADKTLDRDRAAEFVAAANRYDDEASAGSWDPREFFDLTEEICDITYRERWIVKS